MRRALPSTKTDSPGVEEEPTGEGDNEEDDGEVELELLILIFICKPAGKHKDRLGARGAAGNLCPPTPSGWVKVMFCWGTLGKNLALGVFLRAESIRLLPQLGHV